MHGLTEERSYVYSYMHAVIIPRISSDDSYSYIIYMIVKSTLWHNHIHDSEVYIMAYYALM